VFIKKPLTTRKIINVKGKIHHNESRQAWSNIKLKRELINEFPQLKEKRANFFYELMFCRTQEDLDKALKELSNREDVVPMLMFLYKEN